VKKTSDGDTVDQHHVHGCVYSLAFITGFAGKDCRVSIVQQLNTARTFLLMTPLSRVG